MPRTLAATHGKLTPKQRAFIDAFLQPEVFTCTEAARRAGYATPEKQGWAVFRTPYVQAALQRRLAAVKLSPTAADLKLAQQLEAMETKFFAHEGVVVDQKEVVNWSARADALEKLLKLQGRFKVEGSVTLIQITYGHRSAPPTIRADAGETGDLEANGP